MIVFFDILIFFLEFTGKSNILDTCVLLFILMRSVPSPSNWMMLNN